MIPFILPIVCCCAGVFDIISPKVIDKKHLKLCRENIRKYEDFIEELERNIRDDSEMLEAARNDFDMYKGNSEVDIVSKKQYIRELEERIEALKEAKKRTEESKKESEEKVAKLAARLY